MSCWACRWVEELVQNSRALELPLYLTRMMVRHHVIKWDAQSRTEATGIITLQLACRSWSFHFFLVAKTQAASISRLENAVRKLCGFLKVFSIVSYGLRKSHAQWLGVRRCTFPFYHSNRRNSKCHPAWARLYLWLWGCAHKPFRPIALCSKGPLSAALMEQQASRAAKRQTVFLLIWCCICFLPRSIHVCFLCLFNKANNQKTVMLL